ncbi:MAG: hypothetical protein ACR2OJ_14180 [Hyphomicrobiales bacterium]
MKLMWLAAFLILYALVCLGIAIYCARRRRDTSSTLVSTIGFSTIAFAGWLVVSYPAGIYANGLGYGALAFAPLAMAFAAAAFYERINWLSARYQVTTPGDLFAQYFRTEFMRVPVALIALSVALAFLVAVFKASGDLLYLLTEESLPPFYGASLSAVIVTGALLLGGRCALVRLSFLQTALLILATYLLGFKTIELIGGVEAFAEVFKVLQVGDTANGTAGANKYLSMPDNCLADLGGVFAYTGIIVGPAFLLWAIRASSASQLRGHYIVGLAGLLSVVLLTGMSAIGFAGHLLGANLNLTEIAPDAIYNVLAAALGAGDITEHELGTRALVPLIVNVFGQTGDMVATALSGFMGVAFLAAMHASAGAILYLSAVVISSDGVMTSANKIGTRIIMVLLGLSAVAALFVGGVWHEYAAMIALAAGCLMWPALLAICFVHWFTAPAIIMGMISGALAIGGSLYFEPKIVHQAVAGLAVNFSAVIIVSLFTQAGVEHRAQFHRELRAHTSLIGKSAIVLCVIIVWSIFAFGPAAFLGENAFGKAGAPESWLHGLAPPLWVWQLCWWLIGMIVLYWAANRFGMRAERAENG